MRDDALRDISPHSFIFYLVFIPIVGIIPLEEQLCTCDTEIYREGQAGVGVLPPHEGPEPG